ncbi:SARP family transcriptional regulator [Catellatospora sp. TT07R-123]|nr:SARP family transcriptional regulator [Catellatospora sp. TT07R-123]
MLGSVGVWADGAEVEIGPSKRRAVLALLATRLGSITTTDQIVDFVWDADPPPKARRVVIVHISRLRAVLAEGGIDLRAAPGGYLLSAPAHSVDALRFRAAVAAAALVAAPEQRSAALRDALALWRGDALAGIGDSPARHPIAAGLEQLRLAAVERRITADLDAGRHRELRAELAELVALHPGHEGFSTSLMLAAWRSGERTETLHEYQRLREHLASELGISPGPQAQALFTLVLQADGQERPPDRSAATLPAHARIFEGRSRWLARLDHLAAAGDTAPVVVLSGMGGVGKTALAVRWAQSAADRFPDGRLYVDLRGFDGRRPLTMLEALTRLLVAVGTPPAQLPTDPDLAAASYRAALADKRAVVVLDNARSAAQVRELLPGGRHTVVLITSRTSLTGLVARDDAIAMPVDVFSPDESVALIDRLFAQAGVFAEPHVLRQLADLCGHLPLAIRIMAANLTTGTGRTPADTVALLRDGARLTALEVPDDPASALALVFEHSYRPLDRAERRLFRLLGAAPCADYTVAAAAALTGGDPAEAAVVVRRLVDANLLIEVGADRVGFHDLIRELAESHCAAEDPDEERTAAMDRLLAWYVGLGVTVHEVVNPQLPPVVPTVGFPTAGYPFGRDPAAATAFLGAEMANVLAVIRDAAGRGREEAASQIPVALYHVLERGIAVTAAIDLAGEALAIARARGDLLGERRARNNLGAFYNNARNPAQALVHLERAIEIARLQQAPNAEATAYCNLGVAYKAMNDTDSALAAFLAAHALRPGAPNCAVLNNIGNAYANRGDYDLAAAHLTHALQVARATGVQADESLSLINLGHLELRRGRHDDALDRLRAAHALARDIGNSRVQLDADVELAQVYAELGRPQLRREHLRDALALARGTGDRVKEQEILLALDAPE